VMNEDVLMIDVQQGSQGWRIHAARLFASA